MERVSGVAVQHDLPVSHEQFVVRPDGLAQVIGDEADFLVFPEPAFSSSTRLSNTVWARYLEVQNFQRMIDSLSHFMVWPGAVISEDFIDVEDHP